MPKLAIVLALCAALLLPFSTARAATPNPPDPPFPSATSPTVAPLTDVAVALLAAINADRAKHRAAPLVLDAKQSICSRKHSLHMASLGYISHDQFPSDICVQHGWAGENVGAGYGSPLDAALMLHRMMMKEGPCPHSSCSSTELAAHGHYLNLINTHYKRIGIGIVARNGTLWLTENFTD